MSFNLFCNMNIPVVAVFSNRRYLALVILLVCPVALHAEEQCTLKIVGWSASVHPDLIDQMIGHKSQQRLSIAVYARDAERETKAKAIDHLSYPGPLLAKLQQEVEAGPGRDEAVYSVPSKTFLNI